MNHRDYFYAWWNGQLWSISTDNPWLPVKHVTAWVNLFSHISQWPDSKCSLFALPHEFLHYAKLSREPNMPDTYKVSSSYCPHWHSCSYIVWHFQCTHFLCSGLPGIKKNLPGHTNDDFLNISTPKSTAKLCPLHHIPHIIFMNWI